jgi:hypothetical protein
VVDIEGNIRIFARPAAVGRGVFPIRGARFSGGLLLAARRDEENDRNRREGER